MQPSQTPTPKAYSKSIKAYYEKRALLQQQGVIHELGVRSAFHNLLDDTARLHKWALYHEPTIKLNGKTIRPDGLLKDENGLWRGYWEAKDSEDDLEREIELKKAKGYPFSNIIFEDSRQAVLFQGNREAFRVADLTDERRLTDLLAQFYSYIEPDYASFAEAVPAFKERVAELGAELKAKIDLSHRDNAAFKAAFAQFHELCKTSLNPGLSVAQVDEMIIQHLLTDRLIRKVFDNPDFRRRNVIAAEIEKVIDALTSHFFNREDYLKSLDRYYVAIENAARHMDDFQAKQDFLNQVYERFFQGYSVRTADTHGIVYTPQPIVDFMCASVEDVLQTEFGKRLGDPGVVILDPCTGTGNFIVNLIKRAPADSLDRLYRDGLYANEIMLLPYYVAALNIEHTYYERTGDYQTFEGLCFVDTLDLKHSTQKELTGLSEENRKRINRQSNAPITVIIGNPPYNAGQKNENENNQNRKYEGKNSVDASIKHTYAQDSTATLKSKVYDPFVKFFRWATDRLQEQDGIVCYITNNKFIDGGAYDGMRKHLLKDFSLVYHVDLHGDVNKNPKLSGTTHNVFGIKLGVGITIAIKSARHTDHKLFYVRLPEDWRKEQKFSWLTTQEAVGRVKWTSLSPDAKSNWIEAPNQQQFDDFLPIGRKDTKAKRAGAELTIFQTFSLGVVTARDDQVYDFDASKLQAKVETFIDIYNAVVDASKRKQITIDTSDKRIKWSHRTKEALKSQKDSEFDQTLIRNSLYRPFNKMHLYFDDRWIERRYLQPQIFPNDLIRNQAICVSSIGSTKPFHTLMVDSIPDYHLTGDSQCFPFYTYDADGSNRRENITDWALAQFRARYADDMISKWDIFYYVYGLLHSPDYRGRYAESLRRELPRLPYAEPFRTFAEAGRALADLHLTYESVEPYALSERYDERLIPLRQRYHVTDKMALSKDKASVQVNKGLRLEGIPPEAFAYKLGGRSALEWVIDQYKVKGASDPNRPDDPGYIVGLLKRVVTVSVRTAAIVAGLPSLLSP